MNFTLEVPFQIGGQKLMMAAMASLALHGDAARKHDVTVDLCHVEDHGALPPEQTVTLNNSEAPQRLTEITIPADANWGRAEQKRFMQLAKKEALESLSREEAHELDRLQRIRRRFEAPLTAKEVENQIKREKLFDDMEALLKRYVDFKSEDNTA